MTLQDLASAPDVLTISDLQRLLNVGRSTAYRLVSSGEIGCVRIGRAIRIPKKFVANFMDNNAFFVDLSSNLCYNKNVTADSTGLS